MLGTLKATPAFTDCTTSELEKVAGICGKITLKKGDQLFAPDTSADTVYIVVDGAIELRFYATYYNERQPIPVDRLFKGDLVGWSALTEGGHFTLAAVAMQDTELLRMEGEELRRLCADNPHFGYVFQRNVAAIIARRFTTGRDTVYIVAVDGQSPKTVLFSGTVSFASKEANPNSAYFVLDLTGTDRGPIGLVMVSIYEQERRRLTFQGDLRELLRTTVASRSRGLLRESAAERL